jgi:GAF domain
MSSRVSGPLDSGATGRAALERRTIHIHDVQADPEYSFGAKDVEAFRTVLTVPMLKGDELLGVILTYRLEVKPFTDPQIALVETFTDQAVIAIENARLFDEVQARTQDLSESLRQQTATAEVLKTISRTAFDLQRVFDTLVENAVRLCDAERALLFRFDGEFLRSVASYNVSPELRDFVDRNRSVVGNLGSSITAIRAAPGRNSRKSPRCFAPSSGARKLTPVTLPPGRLRLVTRPSLTGSPPIAKTIGTVVVAALAASAPGVLTITVIGQLSKSATSAGSRSNLLSAQRYSIAQFRPSTTPASLRPSRTLRDAQSRRTTSCAETRSPASWTAAHVPRAATQPPRRRSAR